MDAGLWEAESEDEAELIAFAKEAESLLNEHLDINALYWDPKNADEHAKSNRLLLQELEQSVYSSL